MQNNQSNTQAQKPSQPLWQTLTTAQQEIIKGSAGPHFRQGIPNRRG